MPKKLLLNNSAICFILSLTTLTILTTTKVYAGTTTPVTTYTQTPSSPDGKNNWYVTPVTFDLQATDLESGVKEINYKIDNGGWQKVSFENTLNLVQNPSMETADTTTSGLANWEATLVDGTTTYSRDITTYAPSFSLASAKITSTTPDTALWHGINNKQYFAVSYAYKNMTAEAWVKTQNAANGALFKIYSLSQDEFGNEVITLIGQSSTITGTAGWQKLSLSFIALPESVTGVYIDIGLYGSGTVWVDAVSINSSNHTADTSVVIASDSESHTFEFYSVDQAGNAENHSCTSTPKVNCVTFKLDTTPPGNWHNSGAFRGLFGSSHELYVYTNVEDETSGLSVFTDKYQYHTDKNPGFGRFSNLLNCNSTWQPDTWTILISPPFSPGANSAYLLTPKTDFCNSDWKTCKTVRFFSEDMAGNTATKDFCINGPWVKVRGEGVVGANGNIDMLSEADGDNTDGLIQVGGYSIDFFTSSKDWYLREQPIENLYDYDRYFNTVKGTKTAFTGNLPTTSGIFTYNGNYNITNSTLPNNYDDDIFSQVIFINGDLTVSKDVTLNSRSAALFIVKGDAKIDKDINTIHMGILADGDIYSAYDMIEGDTASTLTLKGLFHGDQIFSQRTLQGTNNDNSPSEDFTYEPKYLVKLKSLFGKNTVRWESVE
uniref:CBM-cenC domain-containing protein n=1 Tax=candidate division WWE3 bacterium TaxID=2053526 RepID=A0A7C4TS89_UNCKA